MLELATTHTIARRMRCSVEQVKVALDEAQHAYDTHVLAQKVGRWLRGAVLPDDRRASTDAVRAFTACSGNGPTVTEPGEDAADLGQT